MLFLPAFSLRHATIHHLHCLIKGKSGIPREIKSAEKRVAATPSGVKAFIDHNHQVFVEKGAGLGSGFRDEEYVKAGAKILDNPDDVWGEADMVIKVKEPIGPEFDRMKPGQILYTYLHLAADQNLTQKLLEIGSFRSSAGPGDRHRRRCCRAFRRYRRSRNWRKGFHLGQ
ncbi:MAG: hypothetical protein B1H13_12200 [Desulfobacteraceae bacterium 4484_190.3]|nr:MAG: hypothetical protein B1H13_12200 [Desulfobacteraceae bacterium 4484_190.3]